MIEYKTPSDVCKEAKEYMKTVLARLEDSGVLENVDIAALDMLARNYSMFINASKQIERDGATITNVHFRTDRKGRAPLPANGRKGSV